MIRVMLVILALTLVACGDDDAVNPPDLMSADDFIGWWAGGGIAAGEWLDGFELRDIPSPEGIGDVPRGVLIRWVRQRGCEDNIETPWYLVGATEHTATLILGESGLLRWVLERDGDNLTVTSAGGSGTWSPAADPCP